jgi:hypothetical protein
LESILDHPPNHKQPQSLISNGPPSSEVVSSRYICREQESFEVRQARWRTAVLQLDLPQDIRWWSAEHVADWLDFIGFSQHSDNFLNNGINGQVLSLFSDTSLLKEIVQPVGERVMILLARDMLLSQQQQQHNTFATRRSAPTQRSKNYSPTHPYVFYNSPFTNHEETEYQQSVSRPQQ